MQLLLPFTLLIAAFVTAAASTAVPAPLPSSVSLVPHSMVQTSSIYPGQDKSMLCSAFVVNAARGFALTAEHCVVKDQVAIYVDGEETEVLRKSAWLALIKVRPMSKPPLSIAKDQPKLGESTWGFGWAFGKVFLQLHRLAGGYDKTDLVVDGAFIEGMSGGPVVNAQGEVVGVIQGGVPGAAWLSGVKEIREFLEAEK